MTQPENVVEWWVAKLADGTEFSSATHKSIDEAHAAGDIHAIVVKLARRDDPINCSCRDGERIHMFTRRAIRMGSKVASGEVEANPSMPVIEVFVAEPQMHRRQPGEFKARNVLSRLYMDPVHGLVFSTRSINL